MNTVRDTCVQQLRAAMPEVMTWSEEHGGPSSLLEYARAMPGRWAALQDGQDFVDLAVTEATRLFSPAAGIALRRQWEERFLALTANHLGVDLHPEFLQGNMVMALGCAHAVPLLACGGVPCNNMAFPRGLLLPPKSADTTLPRRLPLLPVGDRHAFVSAQKPLTAGHIRSALDSLIHADLKPDERPLAKTILAEIFGHAMVLAQASFRDQMCVANALFWQRLTKPELHLPPLVCLDLQHLCRHLISFDLRHSGSLVHDILLESELTDAILYHLDGTRACWSLDSCGSPVRGSFLFWALDEKGRSLSLGLEKDSRGNRFLVAPRCPKLRFPLQAQALQQALHEERLLPTLYLSFVATGMARGLACAGGIFQYAYLPTMTAKTAEALHVCRQPASAERLRAVCPLGTGFHALQVQAPHAGPDAAFHTAGGWDILRCGGLSESVWADFGAVDPREAFRASWAFQYEDIIPRAERHQGWLAALRQPAPCLLPQEPLQFPVT